MLMLFLYHQYTKALKPYWRLPQLGILLLLSGRHWFCIMMVLVVNAFDNLHSNLRIFHTFQCPVSQRRLISVFHHVDGVQSTNCFTIIGNSPMPFTSSPKYFTLCCWCITSSADWHWIWLCILVSRLRRLRYVKTLVKFPAAARRRGPCLYLNPRDRTPSFGILQVSTPRLLFKLLQHIALQSAFLWYHNGFRRQCSHWFA